MMRRSGDEWGRRESKSIEEEGNLFRGATTLTLDAKGRMAVPKKYRYSLEQCCASQLVITADPDRCLLVYPLPEWQEIERKLSRLPSLNPQLRQLQRFYVGYASDVEMDAQGRILLPVELRRFANLQKQVLLIGQINKLELWDEAAWNSRRDAWLQATSFGDLSNLPELQTFSL